MKIDFGLHYFTADRGYEYPPEYDISEHGRSELGSYKEFHENAKLYRDVELMVAEGKFYGQIQADGAVHAKVKKMRRGLAQFIDGVESGGPWLTLFMLTHQELAGDENREKGDYRESHDRAFHLESFVQRAKLYESLLANMEGDGDLQKGRPRNTSAYIKAMQLAETFQERGIPLSSYKDGKYFQVLRIVLNEIFPDMKPEAYRRYGTWALDHIEEMGAQNSA